MINPQKKNPKKAEKHPVVTPKRTVRWRAVFISVAVLVFVGLGSLSAYAFYISDKILPNTLVSGVQVGGLSREVALRKLSDQQEEFSKKDLSLFFEEKTWNLASTDLKLSFNNQPTIDQVYAIGKQGRIKQQVFDYLSSLVRKTSTTVAVNPLSDEAKKNLSEKVLKEIEIDVSETSLSFVPGKVEILPGKAGQKLDYDIFRNSLESSFASGDKKIGLVLTPFQPEITAEQAEPARVVAERILSSDWVLKNDPKSVTFTTAEISKWLGSEVERVDGVATGLKLTLKDDELKKLITDFAKKSDTQPVNAILKQEGGALVVSRPAQEGRKMELDPTISLALKSISEGLEDHVIIAQAKVAPADLRADNIAELGLKEQLGQNTTDYSGSPTNRKLNIELGQRSLNGALVKDGETYSTTTELGPVDRAHGYLPELVIKGNRTIPEDGGGLCQVSTTLFRAVLDAGLPVVARTNHSYRVGYYERNIGPGLDATVYIPNPDFKWKNDTGNAIYIQSYVVGTKITFELFGTRDGRSSRIDGPTITENLPVGEPIYADTDTLFVGETKQVETAHNGARTTATYTVTRNGEQINQQVFNSYYRPWPAQFLRGTKAR